MKRITFIVLLLCTLTSIFSLAQKNQRCGTTALLERQKLSDPDLEQRMAIIEKQTQKWIKNNSNMKKTGVVITIPVVVHVIWNTSVQNISDAQILSQITVLNQDFRRLNPDTSNTPAAFQNVSADVEVEFCLANQDPFDDPTTGIIRTQTSETAIFDGNKWYQTSLGGQDIWDRDKYMNIYVGMGAFLGFAYYPGAGAALDAIFVRYDAMGSIDYDDGTFVLLSAYDKGRTATHEAGHWLNLKHPFDGGCVGTDASTCSTQGDNCCDTPPTASANYGCPGVQNTCTETPVDQNDMTMNFIDYVNDACMNLFTYDQKARVLATLGGIRSSLTTSLGCGGTTAFPPVANFTANITTVVVGNSVNFTDQSTNTPTSWSWTFTGGTPNSSTSQYPAITYDTIGLYDVTLTATNANGSNTLTKTAYIDVIASSGGVYVDTSFYLDGLTYYINPTDQGSFVFNMEDNDGLTPNSSLPAGYSTDWMIFYTEVSPGDTNFYLGAVSWFDPPGQADNWIEFGPVTIPACGAKLSWQHRMYSNSFRDGYEVLITTTGMTIIDFTTNGTTLFSISDNDPTTSGNTTWTPQSVIIDGGIFGGQQVYIAFHHNANDMILLYLDDILIEDCSTVGIGEKTIISDLVSIYPNPANGYLNVFCKYEQNGDVKISVYDILGSAVYSKKYNKAQNNVYKIDLSSKPKGIYFIRINNQNYNVTKKVVLY